MPETWVVIGSVLSATGIAVLAAALWLRARRAPESSGELPGAAMQTVPGPPGPNALQRAVLAIGRIVFGRAVCASEAGRGSARLALIRIVITSTLALSVPMVAEMLKLPSRHVARIALGHGDIMGQFGASFGRGVLDTKHVVLYAAWTLFFVFVATRLLEARRWR